MLRCSAPDLGVVRICGSAECSGRGRVVATGAPVPRNVMRNSSVVGYRVEELDMAVVSYQGYFRGI